MRFPLNSLYLIYFYIIIFFNFIYLLGTELNISFYFIDYAFCKTNFSYIVEFIFSVIFIIYINCIYVYNNNNSINNLEFLFITFNCTIICILLLNATNFFIIFILLELLSLCLYVLAAFNRRKLYSIEAGIKYFILGSFSSSLILIGIIFLYGLTGFFSFEDLYILFLYNSFFLSDYYLHGLLIALTFILVGFLFKLYSAPFHF
jgi:NADH-quinone oxidoreductase subunit N